MSAKELQTIFRNYYKSASLLKTHTGGCDIQISLNILKPPITFSVEKQFRDETDPLAIECKEEAKLDRLRFIEQLKDFLVQHSDSLFESQINQIKNKIRRMEAIKGEKADNSLPNVEKKKRLTAFDFYKSSKKHKYTHLGEEERDAKLLRHFEKLEDEFEKFTKNSQPTSSRSFQAQLIIYYLPSSI
uniref:Uncharacterized protein n=1 Tax=Ditylenchus dipsaci TaxID=166011 RepID=A0A915DHC6_9BILA